MPWEQIGTCGNGTLPEQEEWILPCYDLAISYLKFVLGSPPEGCDLGIIWNKHELIEYPSLGLYWDQPQIQSPDAYVNQCMIILERFNLAIDWDAIDPSAVGNALQSLGHN